MSQDNLCTRILSLNIRYGFADDGENSWSKRADSLSEMLKKSQADIIVLQEALNFQLDYIQHYLGDWARIGVGRDDGAGEGEHCPILFSPYKWECLDNATFWLSETPNTPGSKSWDAVLPRICTWAKMQNIITKQQIYIFNTHFDHVSALARKNSAILIQTYMNSFQENAVILCGDFNEPSHGNAIKELCCETRNNLQLAWKLKYPTKPTPGTIHHFTGKAEHANDSIDHVLVNKHIQARDIYVDAQKYFERWPSDHFAVVIDFYTV